jgi:hypothetical protein
VQATFDKAALVQRCQLYKLRNVMDHLPERQRPWVQAIMRQACRSDALPRIARPIAPISAVRTSTGD